MEAYELRVQKIKWLNPTVFELSVARPPNLNFEAGQFLNLEIPKDSKIKMRAYSIASAPESNDLDFCIKIVKDGLGSNYLSKIEIGSFIRAKGPYGHFTYKSDAQRKVYFIATGTGIAPFRSMLLSKKFAEKLPAESHVLLGVRALDEIIYQNELSTKVTSWVTAVSREKSATTFDGRVTDILKQMTRSELLEADFYLCGNGDMVFESTKYLESMGVKRDHVFKEIYFKPANISENPTLSA